MNLRSISCVIALALAPMAANAGNLSEPVQIPQITPAAPVIDWSGAYVGLGFGSYAGDASTNDPTLGGQFDLDNGTRSQVFGGYQFQNGSVVYGGELALGVGGGLSAGGVPIGQLDKIFDLKARLGYAVDSVLLYGVMGYSSAQIDLGFDDFSVSGMNYGIGVDYAVSDNFVVGAEYLMRKLDASDILGNGVNADGDLNSFSLRAAYRF